MTEGTATQPSLVEQYEQRTGRRLAVTILAYRAENVRLSQMFIADLRGPEVPDAAEVEIGQVARYFRPPLGEVGFLPLNEYIQKSGWSGRVLPARLAPWSKEGQVFGLPHDVHPVSLSYRADLFEEAGVDLSACTTWAQFHEACLRFQDYWRARGVRRRWALEMNRSSSGILNQMLLQRHIVDDRGQKHTLNLVDDRGVIRLNHPKVAQTLAMYAQMLTGPRAIGCEPSSGERLWSVDLADGVICAMLTADWRIAYMKKYAPALAGKMRMMPLPVFEEGDAPTSTAGGTMIGIPRNCRDPEASWRLIELLYLSPEGIEARQRHTAILPPIPEMWKQPRYQQADAYFGGQKIDQLYIDLAGQLPARCVTPATSVAEATLSYILTQAARHVEVKGSQGLEAACQRWLDAGAEDLERRIRHGRFD